MYQLSAKTIARVIGAKIVAGTAEACAQAVSLDSREVRPHTLFAALKGERSDGHSFVRTALEGGASIVIIEDPKALEALAFIDITHDYAVLQVRSVLIALQDLASYQRDLIDVHGGVKVIGVTGSTGKTSTKEFIASILSTHFKTVATLGNQNNELGAPLTLLRVKEDTQVLVVEMGMRGRGQVRALARMARPHIGCISTLGTSHIELLGSREEIARAKAELFAELPSDGHGYYRAEEDFTEILKEAAECRTTSIGFSDEADLRLTDATTDRDGRPSARLSGPFGTVTLKLKVPGVHHLVNASFGVAIGAELGMNNEELERACAQATLSGMRFKKVCLPDRKITFINDAYNANPTSMTGSCRTFAVLSVPGRRIAVLGDMLELGDFSQKAHRSIGELCTTLGFDAVFAYGDYAEDLLAPLRAMKHPPELFSFETGSLNELCEQLDAFVQPDDTILLKASRGCAFETIIDRLGEGSC